MYLFRVLAPTAILIANLGSAHAVEASTDGEVSGTVTVSTKPLAEGRIFFHLTDGQFVGCKVRAGKYRIERVPVGTRRLTFEGEGVPAKYNFEDKSGLVTEIKSGANTLDFVLR